MTDDPDEVAMKEPARPAPRLAGFVNEDSATTYFIFVERKVLCTVQKFSKALMLWFIAHYVFNLEYPRVCKEVGLFFQEFVFCLPKKAKKSATYLTVTSDIQKYTNF